MSGDKHAEQEPEVFAVEIDDDKVRLSRRHFVEIVAASGATAVVVTGCGEEAPKPSSPTNTPEQTPTGTPTPTPTSPSPSPTPTKPPGRPGKVKPGHKGTQYTTGGKSYTLPCGDPVPSGAMCTCDCVTVPPECSCVGDTCSCVGDTGCSCVGNTGGGGGGGGGSHYWYPN